MRSARHRPAIGVLLALCWTLCAASVAASPEFRAPYSGERVSEYQVSLPVSPGEKRSFRIPAECAQAHAAFGRGARQWGSRVERRVWDKVMQDCYYLAFLQQSDSRPVHDYVSCYDFRNADLRELVAARVCSGSGEDPCEPPPPGVIDLRQLLARTNGETDKPFSSETCRIRNGLFRGWVEFGDDGISCRADRRANGFRIVAVDFSDVNADGYVDAVIRVIPVGRGLRHTPLILPLTRKKPDGMFSIPRDLVRF